MKKITIKFLAMLIILIAYQVISTSSFAQAPTKMSYQAVIRNSSDQLVIDHAVRMKISILHGSTTGTAVYVETQSKSTNANGLVTLEIGGGTIISGSFSGIDWSAGPYFIKTETDPTGGTSYTITGTSQLLSVPYAFYATTAENGFSGNYNDLTNKPITDGSETKVGSGINILVQGDGTTANPYWVNVTPHYIGDSYGGGIVFYVYSSGGQHGLIAATADQSTGIQWSNGVLRYTGTTGDGVGAGAMNTALIVATQLADNQTGNFAAKVCADYSVTVGGVTYGDWYLPSKFELNLLYMQKSVVSGFGNYYWSSTEDDSGFAWYQDFHVGLKDGDSKASQYYVRAIRAF